MNEHVDQNSREIEYILNFVAIVILVFLTEIFKFILKRHRLNLEVNRNSISTYSVIVTGLQLQVNQSIHELPKEFENYLETKLPGCTMEIMQIILLYDIRAYAIIYSM